MIIWVNRVFCLIILIGIFLIYQSSILYNLRLIIWPIQAKFSGTHNVVRSHLIRIFQVITNGKHVNEKVTAFIWGVLTIFVLMSYLFIRGFGINGIIIAGLIAAIPYGYIRTKLYVIQVNASFEGEMLIDELLNQYKICDHNIYAALDACVKELKPDTLSKRATLQLAIRIKTFEKEGELREALKDFIANWNTIWARMIADNIYNAVWEQVDVLHGLENILDECKGISKKIEKDKREGLVSDVVVKVLCPLFFCILIWMAKSMVSYSWQTMLQYEFVEKKGLMIFSMIVLLSGFNVIIFPVLGKRKYDF
ncbi:hypothetical protein [Anaerovorax sp. IOR16]|uniref:hypothetical protein n=1 Tax=Anaerovorax sp. IOR16 TaxID=2773458 RepID=UPI0019D08747|nr:hypothetical protein [Anaerovorax sp. IOR16]